MSAPVACPQCGASVHIETDAETETPVHVVQPMPHIELRRRTVVAAFCSGCEWVHVIDRSFIRAAAAA